MLCKKSVPPPTAEALTACAAAFAPVAVVVGGETVLVGGRDVAEDTGTVIDGATATASSDVVDDEADEDGGEGIVL